MKNSQSKLRLVPGNPGSSNKQTDTSGNPSETYHWAQLTAVRQERQHQFRYPYLNMLQPTSTEMTSVERRVREELYPMNTKILLTVV